MGVPDQREIPLEGGGGGGGSAGSGGGVGGSRCRVLDLGCSRDLGRQKTVTSHHHLTEHVFGIPANTGGFQGTLEVSMSARTPTAGGEVSWIQRQEDHTPWLFHHSSPPRSEGPGHATLYREPAGHLKAVTLHGSRCESGRLADVWFLCVFSERAGVRRWSLITIRWPLST